MVYSLGYTRPPYVSRSDESLSSDAKRLSIDESVSSDNASTCIRAGIPPALSFDNIISGGTCPPVTVRDMMNYLKYIEHSAENLQFFLWFRNYSERWEKLPASEKVLAPEWSRSQLDAEVYGAAAGRTVKVPVAVNALFKDALQSKPSPTISVHRIDPFNTPPQTNSLDEKREAQSEFGASLASDDKSSVQNNAEQAFDDAGMHWKPFTAQPFRDEIKRVIGTYIAEGSPRELNLSARERQAVLHALQHTTHPSALSQIVTTVEYSLRRQAHPNFIRWTICNGNPPRVFFARGLGLGLITIGLLADIILALSSASRAWRMLPLIAWLFGIATLVAAVKGMCVVLHGLHHRHLRPWELFSDEEGTCLDDASISSADMVGGGVKNSFETEPWVPKYEKRNVIRKIFDRQIWVQEPALRQIQDTIFLQSLLAGLVLGGIAVGIFCAFPKGNYF